MLDMHRLAGQGSSALEVSGQSISKCSKNNKNIPLNSTQFELSSNCLTHTAVG